MKLINYTTRLFFRACLFVMIPACVILFFAMRKVFREEMDDNLRNTRMALERQLPELLSQGQHNDLLGDKIFISSEPADTVQLFGDTLLLTPEESELEPFRMFAFSTAYRDQVYRVLVCRKQIESKDLVLNIALWVLLVPAGLLFVALFWIRKRSDVMWAPFYQTLRGMRNFSLTSGHPLKSPDTTVDEFKELGTTIHDMHSKMLHDFNNVQQFTGNASHEIQTPIAVILGKIDLLAQKSLDQDTMVELASIRTAAQRLSRLNESLLMLSRLDNRQFAETELVHLDQVLDHQLGAITPVIEEQEFQMSSTLSPCAVEANPTLVDSLISNLLMNAVRHNVPGGVLQILLAQGELEIRNSGPSPTRPTAELKQRFMKGDASAHSTGLGLAIVSEICTMYGWQFDYTYSGGLHTTRVKFGS